MVKTSLGAHSPICHEPKFLPAKNFNTVPPLFFRLHTSVSLQRRLQLLGRQRLRLPAAESQSRPQEKIVSGKEPPPLIVAKKIAGFCAKKIRCCEPIFIFFGSDSRLMSCKTDSSYEKKRKIQVQRRQRHLRPRPPFRPVLLLANHEHVSDLNSEPDLKTMNKRSGSSFDEMRWKRARIKMTHHHKHPCPPFNFCCSLFNAYVFVVIMFR